jgi:hypothetical protein
MLLLVSNVYDEEEDEGTTTAGSGCGGVGAIIRVIFLLQLSFVLK